MTSHQLITVLRCCTDLQILTLLQEAATLGDSAVHAAMSSCVAAHDASLGCTPQHIRMSYKPANMQGQ